MSGKLVFIGGVNGVGKTTLASLLAPSIAFTHLTASRLIRPHLPVGTPAHAQNIADLSFRQTCLLTSLQKQNMANIVLDGHYTIQTQADGVQLMPARDFKAIKPHLLVLLRDEPAHIFARLTKRDGLALPLEAIAAHQAREQAHAIDISAELAVPLMVLTPSAQSERLIRAAILAI